MRLMWQIEVDVHRRHVRGPFSLQKLDLAVILHICGGFFWYDLEACWF